MSDAQQTESTRPVRTEWITAARTAAILCVVCQHAANGVVRNSDWLTQRPQWWFPGAVFEAISAGVPLFIMVSGALLLNPKSEPTLPVFLRRRLARVLPAYLVWSAIYTIWKTRGDEVSFTWSSFASDIVFGGAYYHLWFIPMLLGLYMLTPLLMTAVRYGSSLMLWFTAAVLVLWFVVLRAVFNGLEWEYGPADGYVGYFLYFLLGSQLCTLPRNRALFRISVCAWLASAVVVVLLTHTKAVNGLLGEDMDDRNFYPEIFVLSVSAFLALRNLDWPRLFRVRAIAVTVESIAVSSFTIYLLHPILLELHGYFPTAIVMRSDWMHPAVAIPLATVSAVLVCVVFRSATHAIGKHGRLRLLPQMLAP